MAKKKKQVKAGVPSWYRHIWWAVPLLTVFIYLPSFWSDFTLDDVLIIEENTLIRSIDKIPELWSTHYWAGKVDANDKGLYRPLTLTTYALQYSLHEKNASPYHLFNILLHALTCFTLMRLLALLFNNFRLTVLAGVLFAVHPIHTEAVSGIVGRAEIMCALFLLTASISYHHWRNTIKVKWLILLFLSACGAMTSKEHGFMMFFILALQEFLYSIKSKKYQWEWKKLLPPFLGIAVISALLWIIRSGITGPAVPHEEWLTVSAVDRMATSVRTTFEYVFMHLIPFNLSADYWTDQVKITSWSNPFVLGSLLMLFGLIAIAIWRRKDLKSFSWGILFFFLTLAPVSNIFFAAGFLKAERILYIPSIGLIIAMASLVILMYDHIKWRTIAWVLTGLLLCFYIYRTTVRQADWKNNYTLAVATLKTSPNSPRFNNMMGLELTKQNKHQEALQYLEKAVKSNPHHIPALVNLASLYRTFDRNEEAAATLEGALKTDPSISATYVNLMAVYRDMERYDKNLSIALQALEKFPDSAPVLWNAANAYHLTNDLVKAEELRARARAIDPTIGQ